MILVRNLRTLEEVRRAEDLQREIWNMPGDLDVVPLHVLVTAQKNGGLLLGAFDGEEMVGFLFGFLGCTESGRFKHCSHMMGVVARYRGQGIGPMLKARQREFVREQGLDLITWTYDPLERANATLNISKLGAVCCTYLRNIYGDLPDALNQGLPTDRFQVDWWIGAVRVLSRVNSKLPPAPETLEELLAGGCLLATDVQLDDAGLPQPIGWARVEGPAVLAEIPFDFQRLKAQSLSLAQGWRLLARDVFEAYFAAGYTVVGFVTVRQGDSQRSFYIMEPDLVPSPVTLGVVPQLRGEEE